MEEPIHGTRTQLQSQLEGTRRTRMKPYKHLNKRVENISSGCLGTLVEASRKAGSNVWDIGIKFDCSEGLSKHWDTANVWRYNRIVTDDYKPDHGPIGDRIKAIICRLKNGTLPYRLNHITEAREGKDSITLSRRRMESKYWLNVSLWAGQGEWQTFGDTVQDAVDKMIGVLSQEKNQ